ncbi:MAG TPA: ABC transporter ATP-binding protein [Steroidobacteraceae bacterium]|nr:ABC transporter ATP-binding protein [Steroidobacteraceae bacterium]
MSAQPQVDTPTPAQNGGRVGTQQNDGGAGALSSREQTEAPAFVRIDNVTKKFGDFVAVDSVSLDIRQGEIFCLLGGSGSGKTTLLRMLAGFEKPTSGRIFIEGQDMSTIPPYERRVNMMFQSYALFPHMTVEKNVSFGLEQEKLGRQEIKARVAEILDIVKMGSFMGRKPHQLSGGQRQRVALARALVKRPKLLLLDEPLAALDRKLREHTQFELLNIQKRLGVTFIVVTHDQEEAMTLSSRMGVMNHGRIAQVGTPSAIYESPATKFVADFIGSVNMFEGRVTEADSGRIESQELGCTVALDRSLNCVRGATVWTAVRPEKISMSRTLGEEHGLRENVVRGVVKEIAYMGDVSIYLVQIESGKTVRVTLPNIMRDAEHRIARDETVYLSWHGSSPIVLTE